MVWAWRLPTVPIVLQLEQRPPNFKDGDGRWACKCFAPSSHWSQLHDIFKESGCTKTI